jgi:glycosyltransferase involved in cell wall biosynthesis
VGARREGTRGGLPGGRRLKPLIVIDADVLGRRRTGDETYVRALLRELAPLVDRERLAAVTRRPELIPDGIEPIALQARSQVARMAYRLPRLLRRLRPAVAHFNYIIPPGYRGRAVVTVHDLSFERFPELMPLRDRLLFRTLVPRSVARAARVLAVSEWTKRDLVERYGVSEEKVVVTPNGVDEIFRPNGGAPERAPYALFVGAIQPRKDPLTALRALALLDGDLGLIVVGPEKRGADEVRTAVRTLGLTSRVEFAGHVEHDELAALYRGAACLVFPSRYEGFGLPMLEAMASGTPVVAAATGALPEIAGGAAVLVEPADPAALAGGIERALADRERLVAAGLERARLFRWDETARRTLDVYRELTA